MDHQAVANLVATTRTDTIATAGTYGGATATGVAAVLNWLGENQSGIGVLVMVITCVVTVISALYGVYYRYRICKIAERQGFEALRRSDA